jgi:hypothetical protein
MLGRLTHRPARMSEDARTETTRDSRDMEKDAHRGLDNAKVHWMTPRVFLMGVIVSIGGMIFGYDTG